MNLITDFIAVQLAVRGLLLSLGLVLPVNSDEATTELSKNHRFVSLPVILERFFFFFF